MKKVAISLLLVLALLVSVMAITATAEVDITSAEYRNTVSQKAQTELAPKLAGNPATVEALCPVCNKNVIWRAVSISTENNNGYYFTGEHRYLTADLNATTYFRVTSGSGCFYLNGHSITSSSVAFEVASGCTVNIIGNGKETVSGKNYGSSYTRYGATIDAVGGTLNLFGGTYTKDNSVAGPVIVNRSSAATINIYNGTTIRDGKNSDLGGNIALHVGGAKLNVYGGEISNGQGTQGGNIAVNGDGNCQVNISGGTITSGKATKADGRGGNIISYYSDVNISGGEVSDGEAYIGGNIAMMRSGADLTISGTADISGGKAQHGGNIRTQEGATMTMTGGTVSDGTATGAATSQGGNINANTGSIAVSGGTISGGTADECGGNIFVNPSTSFTISGNANITGGTSNATGGGTIAINNATLTMTGGEITGGTGKLGAAIYMYGGATANVSGGTINGGTAVDGGAVRMQGGSKFTLSGGVVTGGTATSQGGNFCLKESGTKLTVTSGKITSGTSTNQGGNIFANPDTTVELGGGEITGGKSNNSHGGNIYMNAATLTATAGTVATGSGVNGGNIYIDKDTSTNISGLTVSNGTASNGDNIYHAAALTLTNCSLTNESGYSIYSDADLTLVNTTVAVKYMRFNAGKLTLSGSTNVKGIQMAEDNTKLHVTSDFTGAASIDGLTKPADPIYYQFMDAEKYTSTGPFTGVVKLGDYYGKYPQVHGVDGKLRVSSVKLENANDADDYLWYVDAEAAINAYDALTDKTGYYVRLQSNTDVVVPAGKTAYVDFNGESPTNVTVGNNAKLYAFDSNAPVGRQSYTTFNTTDLQPIFRAPNGIIYAAVPGEEEGTMKTAAVSVDITGVSLRTSSAGLYYTATINTHSSVASKLTGGIAVSLGAAPGADFKDTSLYTAQTGFTLTPAGTNINGVLINEILREGAVSKNRADSVIHAVAYIEYDGQTFVSESKGYSLTGVMGLMNDKFNDFELADKKLIKNFYETYATQVDWDLNTIATYVVPTAKAEEV